MNAPTFGGLMRFILENKKDKVFVGDTVETIISKCRKGMAEGTLLYALGINNAINGMILAEDRPEEGVLFVTENLAMNLNNLREFARTAKERKPDRKLEWLKHNIHKTHNTTKFYERLHV